MGKASTRRNARGARRGAKGRTKPSGQRASRAARRTSRGKKQRTVTRHRRTVRFARFETSGKNSRFRPTKAEVQFLTVPRTANCLVRRPPKTADLEPSGYGDLLLAAPCCAHMRNYQDSIVGLVRCERTFYLTHNLPPKDFACVEMLRPSRGIRRDQTAPRVPAYTAPTPGRRQDMEVRHPPPTRRRSDLYDEIVQERNKLHENAMRVSDFHRNECVGLEDGEEPVEEPVCSRQFVDPQLVQHCPDCEKDAHWSDCPICSHFI